jgi:hypothetical protein
MAPSNSSSGAPMGGMSSNAPPANGAAAPAPNGAVNAPDVTAATPGAAPGKTAPNAGNAQSAMNPPAHPWHHHWSSGSGSLPQNASASTYLHIASAAIGHHNTALAEDALSHAETRLLNRAVPQGQVAADDTPAIQSIESARQALHTGNFSQASADARQAASSASSS